MSIYSPSLPYHDPVSLAIPSRAYSAGYSGYDTPRIRPAYGLGRSRSYAGSSYYSEPRDYDYDRYRDDYGYDRSYSTYGDRPRRSYSYSYQYPQKAYSYTAATTAPVVTYAQPARTVPMVYTTAQPYQYASTYGGGYYGYRRGCCGCF